MRSVDEQMAILMRGVEFGDEQIRETMARELQERLVEGRPLRVYCGYDPTAPDLHLGHTVTIRKLRQFQELGHQVTFLIGTFTGLIGDPSDHDRTRPQQTPEQVRENARTFAQQAFRILDPEKTLVRYNGDWLSELTFADVIGLASHFTVQQFLQRDNFSQRHAKGDPIWLHEFFYALMQGYDAVAMETDVQIGATEQLFNLLAGRKLQEAFGQRSQVCLTLPILVGTDGHIRMSKSIGNYIGIAEPPAEMYGKTMSVPDQAMSNYMNLVTRWTPAEIAVVESALAEGKLHPRDAKMKLAREIVSIFYGDEAAGEAEDHFKTVFQQRELPPDMPVLAVAEPRNVVDLLAAAGMVRSKSEARRLIGQGGVRLDGEKVPDIETEVAVTEERVLQVGRRRFVRLVPGE
ncbi:MAG: tyrosine--tRNA ligase [Anaerolineae bacterium]|nr:MAG: tyrosine--tRNA ligase [Anaerolineae bacterium]